jgi:hypothetical protein
MSRFDGDQQNQNSRTQNQQSRRYDGQNSQKDVQKRSRQPISSKDEAAATREHTNGGSLAGGIISLILAGLAIAGAILFVGNLALMISSIIAVFAFASLGIGLLNNFNYSEKSSHKNTGSYYTDAARGQDTLDRSYDAETKGRGNETEQYETSREGQPRRAQAIEAGDTNAKK